MCRILTQHISLACNTLNNITQHVALLYNCTTYKEFLHSKSVYYATDEVILHNIWFQRMAASGRTWQHHHLALATECQVVLCTIVHRAICTAHRGAGVRSKRRSARSRNIGWNLPCCGGQRCRGGDLARRRAPMTNIKQ